MTAEPIRAVRPETAKSVSEKPPCHPAGRVCEEGGCTTVLSIYNTKTTCWDHTPRGAPRGLYTGRGH